MFLHSRFGVNYKHLTFLRVVKYPVVGSPAVLARNLTVLDGDELGLPASKLISLHEVLCTGIAAIKPLNNTAEPDEHKRVVVPSLYL